MAALLAREILAWSALASLFAPDLVSLITERSASASTVSEAPVSASTPAIASKPLA